MLVPVQVCLGAGERCVACGYMLLGCTSRFWLVSHEAEKALPALPKLPTACLRTPWQGPVFFDLFLQPAGSQFPSFCSTQPQTCDSLSAAARLAACLQHVPGTDLLLLDAPVQHLDADPSQAHVVLILLQIVQQLSTQAAVSRPEQGLLDNL